MTTISYETAADMALILNYGGATEAVVAGLNKMGLPGLERSVIEVQEFRNAFSRQFAAGGKQGVLSFSGNFVLGDNNGQSALKIYLQNNTKFGPVGNANGEARAYLNYITSNLDSDFMAPDTAQDASSAWQVTKFLIGEADINGVIPFNGEIVCNGRNAVFDAHITADTIALVSGEPCTITDSGSGFVTAGFKDGQTIIIEGSSADDGIYIVSTAVAGTLTLTAAAAMTGETAATNTLTIHGGLQ